MFEAVRRWWEAYWKHWERHGPETPLVMWEAISHEEKPLLPELPVEEPVRPPDPEPVNEARREPAPFSTGRPMSVEPLIDVWRRRYR